MVAKKPPKSGTSKKNSRKAVPPAKRPVAKAVAKAVPKTGPQKVAARKAAIAKKSKVAKAVASPAKYAGSAKIKTNAYDAKWKAKVVKGQKQGNLSKAAQLAFEFTPASMAQHAIVAGIKAVTGRDFDKSPYDKNGKWIGAPKGSRLAGAADFALYATPYGKLNAIRKARKTARAIRLGKDITNAAKSMNRKQTAVVYNKKKALYG